VSSYGGSTVGHDYTTGSPSGAPVGHWVWGGYSGYHEDGYYPSHGYLEPSAQAESSASSRYPDWYAPLERYISYGADQTNRAVEGIGRLERWMDDFATVQTEMQAYIDLQTSMMHDLFGHFGINPDAEILPRFKLGGGAGCLCMSPHLSRFILSFSSYLVICLARWSYHYGCHDC
jgi:hypothetical protein